MHQSALMEVGNIIVGAHLNALSGVHGPAAVHVGAGDRH
jgi:chemotaxis protein CheY-P-specific phosphatase CheC